MDSLDLIRTFCEVAAQGSFTAAAKRLDVGKATVSKYVAELEARLSLRLLNRSTRAVSLTDAGEVLLERCKPILEMMALTKTELNEYASRPRGRLHVAIPYAMATGGLPDLLSQFMGYYPDVTLRLQLGVVGDLVDDGIDIELRFGPIKDENLIMRKLLQMEMVVCAAPAYWKKHGMPTRPQELSTHQALTLIRQGAHPIWRFEEDGQPIDVTVQSRMEASEFAPLIQVAANGLGVLYVPSFAVRAQLSSGALITALDAYARKDVWLSAVYLQRKHNSAALRALLDFLQSRISAGGERRREGKSGRADVVMPPRVPSSAVGPAGGAPCGRPG